MRRTCSRRMASPFSSEEEKDDDLPVGRPRPCIRDTLSTKLGYIEPDDEAEGERAGLSSGVLSRRTGMRLSSSSELIEADVLAELDRSGGNLREASVGETRG